MSKHTWTSNSLQLPTWLSEVRPRQCLFHLWRWFRRTEHRMPAGAKNGHASIIKHLSSTLSFGLKSSTHLGQPFSLQSTNTGALWTLLSEVHLVSNNTHRDFVLRGVLQRNGGGWNKITLASRGHACALCSYLNLIHPRSDAEKAALGSNVVEEQDSVSFTEIGPGDATKPIEIQSFHFQVCFAFNCLSFIYLSWPAVSHICRLVFSPSTSMLFIWKSTPEQENKSLKSEMKNHQYRMCWWDCPPSVVWMSPLNSFSVSLSRKLDFPAPASPAKTRRYIGAGSSVPSISVSRGCRKEEEDNELKYPHHSQFSCTHLVAAWSTDNIIVFCPSSQYK